MFQAIPAKRPRRECWADKLSHAGETIARAITAGNNAENQRGQHTDQACNIKTTYYSSFTNVYNNICALSVLYFQPDLSTGAAATTASKSAIRSEILKQIKDLYDLKTMGAITEDEYKSKKEILFKDLQWNIQIISCRWNLNQRNR